LSSDWPDKTIAKALGGVGAPARKDAQEKTETLQRKGDLLPLKNGRTPFHREADAKQENPALMSSDKRQKNYYLLEVQLGIKSQS